jgi:hypothetical protein
MTAALLDRVRPSGVSRDLLLPVMLTGVAALGAFGAIGSFTNVAAVAAADGWDRPWLLPASVDGAIAFFTGLDFALTRGERKVAWLRWFAWALIGVTIALNVAGKTGLFGILGHAALPALFAAAVEAAKATMTARLVEVADRIPLARWVCAPWPTLRLWRRMRVWGITSYAEALDLERRRFLARLTDRHGSLAAAPARKRELYRIIAAAAGIDVDEQEEEPTGPAPVEVTEAPERPRVTRPAPAKRPPARRPATKAALTDDELAAVACRLAAADPGVLSSWKPLAEALRKKGHRVNNDRVRLQILPLARARMEETPDA